MYVARWSFATQFGKTEDCITLLRKWAVDVGERSGWKIGSIRLLGSVIGGSDSALELEGHFESLNEIESAWDDMHRAHYQREYMQMLQGIIVPGTSRWTVLRIVDLAAQTK
jgi:hypothetical protein